MNPHSITRRSFLGTAAAGCAWCASQAFSPWSFAAGAERFPALPPVRIHKLYVGRTGDMYLAHPTEELARFEQYFSDLERKLGDVQFVGGEMIPPVEVETLAAKVRDADGLVIIHLSGHGGEPPVLGRLIDVGLPTVLFSQPFSGHHWMYFPQWHRQGKNVILIPSSDWKELDRAVGLLRVPASLKKTRIIAWGKPQGTALACSAEKIRERFGAELVSVSNERVQEIYKSIDPKAAEAEAEAYWLTQARRIVEPGRAEIIASAQLFLALKELMAQERAQAVASSHCMGTPRGCLAFSKLNDLGFVGACEGDMDSTLTMLIFAYAFHVPGFISDPVIDKAKGAMVHFHCTSATRMDGPQGKRLPFTIRTQTDSRGGVALEVENRVGQVVTCAKLVNLDTMLLTPGRILETSTSPLACRTQFAQAVPNARNLFLNWGENVIQGDMMTLLHRVVFYGDHAEAIRELGDLMGFKVIEEGGTTQQA
ncbi:MAG TPA: twin-arginine translocation signal domain-containing protein [Verrucomicrobiota bacterium]|nr:twin-arginine translocation signal domain-containing protein [Verrucomicrobiota bacterium]HNU50042.1 twin-arginine translocation signal domain-containing protein [Verrucomicrobiota bacterium]